MAEDLKEMRIGVLCSAGGSAFFTAFDILSELGLISANQIQLITDRSCGAEAAASERGIECRKVPFESKEQFSSDAADILEERSCTFLLLLFSRLIGRRLFQTMPALNIHPGLLPSFPGINATQQALDGRARFVGATLHLVDDGIDTGPIVAQTVSPSPAIQTLEQFEMLSYVQKTYLVLVAYELMAAGSLEFSQLNSDVKLRGDLRYTQSSSPAISNPSLVQGFDRFQQQTAYGAALKP